MKTTKKVQATVSTKEQQENLKNTRRTLKVLQQSAVDKENLAGRPSMKPIKSTETDTIDKPHVKKIKLVEDGTQTGKDWKITTDDLTKESVTETLAEERRLALEETLCENQDLHEQIKELKEKHENEKRELCEKIDMLKEQNKILKEMCDEHKHLVEVLTELLEEKEVSVTESAEEVGERTNPNEVSVAEEATE